MATTYTGNPTATQSPAAAPGVGVAPILSLPVDADPANVASIYQAFKVLADYVAYLTKFSSAGLFGNGSGGDITLTTVSSMSVDTYLNNLTLGSGGVMRLNGCVLYVRDTLTFSGGYVETEDPAGVAGGNGTATQGLGGTGLNSSVIGTVLGGGSGGNGGNAGTAGTAGNGVADSRGGSAGAGGTVGATSGGAAGAWSSAGLFSTQTNFVPFVYSHGGYGFRRGGSSSARSATAFGFQGGAGGGGGAGGAGQGGGGGGAGGGFGVVIARRIITDANNNFRAPGGKGGDGGPGGASASGGGGGGGGAYLIYCADQSGTAQSASACCPGGARGVRGTSGGADGTAGTDGSIEIIPVGF